jgi:protoheme IX farnesyltransferase
MNVRLESIPVTAAPGRARDYVTLAKPRLSLMVVITTLIGFLVAATGPIDGLLLATALLGTALAAVGAAALNMVMEREADGRMRRTANRPLPAGRMHSSDATAFGVAASVAGVAILVTVNPLTAALGALTIVTYLFVYTPLKPRTSLCTVAGAIPGALPPVMGWTAATGRIDAGAVALFAILFFWQLPHFLAIAWMYRDDYARAGYPMLPVAEPDGASTGRQVVVQTLALIAATLVPVKLGMAGGGYAAGALALGAAFLALGAHFASSRSAGSAHRLFLGSIAYLPALLGLLAFGRTF